MGLPLQDVIPVAWSIPSGEFDGLLVGSANVFRHGGEQLAQLLDLPVYAVGEMTARAARESGFTVAASGAGGLQAVVDNILPDRPVSLLRLAGANKVRLDLSRHVSISVQTVYRLADLDIAEAQRELFTSPSCVMLHSVSAAENFLRNGMQLNIERDMVSLAVIGPRVALEVGEGWAAIETARAPSDTALLELAAQVCKTIR